MWEAAYFLLYKLQHHSANQKACSSIFSLFNTNHYTLSLIMRGQNRVWQTPRVKIGPQGLVFLTSNSLGTFLISFIFISLQWFDSEWVSTRIMPLW